MRLSVLLRFHRLKRPFQQVVTINVVHDRSDNDGHDDDDDDDDDDDHGCDIIVITL